ncbi:MAG: hypothetical protein K6C08_04615 [Oscillospiraceae bacterium]|nr:hypothetical protein [Oscillospiraceae bacterium]
MEMELRRRRTNLSTLGTGVIAFGVWTILKTLLYLWVDSQLAVEISEAELPPSLLPILIAFFIFFLVLISPQYLYIGLSARAESRGKKKSPLYLFVTALLLLLNIASWISLVITDRIPQKLESRSSLDYCVSSFVDFTSLAVLGVMLWNGIRIRYLLRAREARSYRDPTWLHSLAAGLINLAIAVMAIVAGFLLHSIQDLVCLYTGCLFCSACEKFVSAFRRTAIVYIQ